MRDWRTLVEQQMRGMALDPAQNAEVIAEIAGHLHEHSEELRRQGMPEGQAVQCTLSQIGDWKTLRSEIEKAKRKENGMTSRVKQFWMPSLVTMLLSMGLLALIQIFGPKPWIAARHGKSAWSLIAPVAVIYLPWLLSLPVIGALGVFLSKRSGGSKRAAFSAITFPVLPYLAFFVIGVPLITILNDHIAHNIMFSALFVGFFAWVLAPGAALLAGGLLLNRCAPRPLSGGQIAGS